MIARVTRFAALFNHSLYKQRRLVNISFPYSHRNIFCFGEQNPKGKIRPQKPTNIPQPDDSVQAQMKAMDENKIKDPNDDEQAMQPTKFGNTMLLISAIALALAYAYMEIQIIRTNKKKKPEAKAGSKVTGVGKAQIGGDWELIDTQGKPISNKDLEGKYYLIYFGFTHCPDICPNSLTKLAKAVARVKKSKQANFFDLKTLFVSVDPDRDNPQKIKKFISLFDPDMIGVTGTDNHDPALRECMKKFKIYATKLEFEQEDELVKGRKAYTIDHTILTYLMSDTNEYLAHLGGNLGEHDLATIILEKINDDKRQKMRNLKIIMIDRQYSLSCYALEHPFQAYYSQLKEMIELADVNNDIYQFRLPDHQHYEKLAANWQVKQYFRYYNTTFIRYLTNDFFIIKNQQSPTIIENVGQVGLYHSFKATYFFLKKNQSQIIPDLQIRAIVLTSKQGETSNHMQLRKWQFQISQSQSYQVQPFMSQMYRPIAGIQYFFGEFCILKHHPKGYSLSQLLNKDIIDNYEPKLRYKSHQLQIPDQIQIMGSFRNTLLYKSLDQNNKKVIFLLNASQKSIYPLHQLDVQFNYAEYLIYQHFFVIIQHNHLFIYEILKGNLMAKCCISSLLEEFQQGSSIIFGVQHKKQPRYALLVDHMSRKIDYFYLMDKEKVSLYHINIEEFLNKSFRNTLRLTVNDLQLDTQQIHQNVLKTLNFRIKKLTTLQQYITQGLKTLSFGNTLRFLQNEQNIFVLSDGLFLFYNSIHNNLSRLSKQKSILIQLQRQLLKLSTKIINESKYQDHIVKGLTIANNCYMQFRGIIKILEKEDNSQYYHRLVESKRIGKLLRQDKNKQLFQLCYQLAIAVKGYEYLEEIQKKKK